MKEHLRIKLRSMRGGLSPEDRAKKSNVAAAHVSGSRAFIRARTVALYAAIGSEADPSPLEGPCLEDGKRVVYPRVEGGVLGFYEARRVELVPSKTRLPIPEPAPSNDRVPLDEIDLFVVPGLGFSRDGARIGYGKGYYDRALAHARTDSAMIGFAFDVQLQHQVPEEPHDVRLHAVATESGLFSCRP